MRTQLLLAAAAACTFGFLARAGADELPWQFDYGKALAEAKGAHKCVLLDFSASWCGPCRLMETTTFADAGVQGALKENVLVKIDIDRQPMLAARYQVQAIPTCILLNAFGELVQRNTGYADAATFSKWLLAGANSAMARATEPKSEQVARSIQQLGGGLEASDPAAREQALAALLTLYCAPGSQPMAADGGAAPAAAGPGGSDAPAPEEDDGAAKLIEAQLRGLVERQPSRAARCLDEPRLAVRILFSTLLAAKLGADFQFDPWAPAATRAALAESWTKRLTPPAP